MIITLAITAVILIIVILTIIIILCRNSLAFSNIKINEAEKNIDSILNQKQKDLTKIKKLILEEIDEKNFLEDIENLNINDKGYFESNKILADYHAEVTTVIDENEKLLNNEKIAKLIEKLDDDNINLSAIIKYYNDSATKLNNKISTFPANIIRIFFGYKRKELYQDEKREIYEILKEK